MQIEREILREYLLVEDVLEQPFVAFAQDDIVVSQSAIRISSFGSQIEHKEGHAVLHALDLTIGVLTPVHFGNQIAIGKRGIGIRHNGICFMNSPIG